MDKLKPTKPKLTNKPTKSLKPTKPLCLQHYEYITLLKKYCKNKKKRKLLLDLAGKEELAAIVEILYNILHNKNLHIKQENLIKFKKLRKNIRSIVAKKTSQKKKKKLLIQKGGFLLGLLAPLVGSVFGSILGR